MNAAYKPVDKKKRAVGGTVPAEALTVGKFRRPSILLQDLPILPTRVEKLEFGERLTEERWKEVVKESLLNEEEAKIANWILLQNEKSLSWNDEEKGMFKEEYIPPYKIPTIEHVPWREKPIPMPPAAAEEITAKIRDKIKAGVYEPSQGSYSSSIFVVKKTDGSYRFVHNMQTLNSITVRDNALPPLLEDYVERFAGLSCVGLLDLYDGYGQYPLHEDSRDLTAFQTAMGPMRLTTVPQGASNSVGVFQRAMNFIINDEFPQTAIPYIDDVGIMGPRTKYENEDGEPETLKDNSKVRRYVWEYLQNLHKVLWKTGKYGATYSGKKIRLCDEVLTIVGFACSYFGRKPTETSMEKVTSWPRCRSVKEVRGFLGTVGPARLWIKDYAKLIRPLTRLTAGNVQDKDFVWTPEADKAFQDAKVAVSKSGWLRPINYKSKDQVYLAVDSSHIAVGWELGQDFEGKRRPARFGSMCFDERQGRYSQSKLELFGVCKALKACAGWLYDRPFRLEVDALYLKQMINAPELPNSAMTRWLWFIHKFDFEIVHVPATKHTVVDGLSRRQPTQEERNDEEDTEEWLDRLCGHIEAGIEDEIGQEIDRVYLMEGLYDEEWEPLGRYLEHQNLEGLNKRQQDRIKAKSLFYFIRNGKIYRRVKNEMPKEVIGTNERRLRILKEAHEEGGHKGALSLKHRVGLRFYWPKLTKDVRQYVQSCDLCQKRDTRRFEEENKSTYPSDIGQVWGIDLVVMPPSQGYRYIIIAREDVSKWVEAKPIRKKEARIVAKFISDHIITRFGYIRRLKSDQGSEFMQEVKKELEKFRIKHVITSGYHPQANGVVERGNGPFKEALYRLAHDYGDKWPDIVNFASWAERTTYSRTTGFTPYRLMMGQDCVLPFDLEEATFLVRGYKDNCTHAELLAHRIRQLQRKSVDVDLARERLALSRQISVRDHNLRYDRRMTEPYKAGDWVLLRDSAQDVTYQTKEKPKWFGPYVVEERTPGRAYRLRELDGSVTRDYVGHNRLKPYYQRSEIDLLQAEKDDEDGDEEEEEEESEDQDSTDDLEWARVLDEEQPTNFPSLPPHTKRSTIPI